MSVRRALLPALISLLLLLTGCGGGQSTADPPLLPPSSSATSPAPKPETPVHFIRRFYRAEKAMENSGEADAYHQMTGPCASCRALVREVTRFYRDGGYVRWGGMQIRSITCFSVTGSNQRFAVKGTASPTFYKSSASANPVRLDGGRTAELLTLQPAGATWLVRHFAKLGDD